MGFFHLFCCDEQNMSPSDWSFCYLMWENYSSIFPLTSVPYNCALLDTHHILVSLSHHRACLISKIPSLIVFIDAISWHNLPPAILKTRCLSVWWGTPGSDLEVLALVTSSAFWVLPATNHAACHSFPGSHSPTPPCPSHPGDPCLLLRRCTFLSASGHSEAGGKSKHNTLQGQLVFWLRHWKKGVPGPPASLLLSAPLRWEKLLVKIIKQGSL